jgi:hypothetical protein
MTRTSAKAVAYVPNDENVEWVEQGRGANILWRKNVDPDAFAQNLGGNRMSAHAGGGARKVTAGDDKAVPFA